MRETEALGAELKQIQEEVDMRHAQVSVGSFFVTITTFLFKNNINICIDVYIYVCVSSKVTLTLYSCFQSKRLQSELSRSEARCDEAETKAAQAAEQVIRLTESISQMEDFKKENESLAAQVFNKIYFYQNIMCIFSTHKVIMTSSLQTSKSSHLHLPR